MLRCFYSYSLLFGVAFFAAASNFFFARMYVLRTIKYPDAKQTTVNIKAVKFPEDMYVSRAAFISSPKDAIL